jgi:hypothetical protein
VTKEVVTSNNPESTVLSHDQQVRVEALDVARRVIVNRGFGSTGKVDPWDLIAVARYVDTGIDPYRPTPDEEEETSL